MESNNRPIASCLFVVLVALVGQATAYSGVQPISKSTHSRQMPPTTATCTTSTLFAPFTTRQRGKSTILQATWSNGQAIQDYQNFLATGKQEIELTDDGPSVILQPREGPTPLAETLLQMSLGDDLVLTPDQELPEQLGDRSEYPIYITLPPYQLEAFLANLPESYRARPDDFVFFSGGLEHGNIEDILKDRGYCRDSMTQVLISGMRVDPNTKQIQDTKTVLGQDASGEDKLAGECAATGKWAGSIAARLERHNVFCRTDFYREWRRRMWERAAYDAAFHLIGAVRDEPTTLQQVANYYSEEVADIVWEFSQLLRGWRAITLTYGFEERLLGIGESAGAEQPCRLVNEMYPYIWGSPVFLESKAFVEYLQYAQNEKGLLQGIELPSRGDDEYTSNMRQGNLRADGVI